MMSSETLSPAPALGGAEGVAPSAWWLSDESINLKRLSKSATSHDSGAALESSAEPSMEEELL